MKILLLSLVGAILAAGNETTPEPIPDVTTPAPTPETTTAVVPDDVTTPEPAPVTTTPAPVTTTPAPAPVTTPAPEPVTTPEPAPVTTTVAPPADKGIRVLKNSNGTACIMVMFQADITLDGTNDTTTIFSNTTTVDESDSSNQCIEEGADVGGIKLTASDTSIFIAVSYTTTHDGNKNITTWRIDDISVITDTQKLKTKDLRAESIHCGSSYSCITGFTANMTAEDNTNSTIATITMSEFRLEVGVGEDYPIKDDTLFAKAESCLADKDESLLVPIIVACALAGLVLAICVAYIIGRRRTYSGYSAM